MEKFGFYVPAKVMNREKFRDVLLRCIRSIRLLQSDPIVIIDDNSPFKFTVEDIPYDNVEIVHNPYPGSGELFPYILNNMTKKFEHYIMIHDSAVLKKAISEEVYSGIRLVKPLWTFNCFHHCEEGSMIKFCAIANRLPRQRIDWLLNYPLNRIDREVIWTTLSKGNKKGNKENQKDNIYEIYKNIKEHKWRGCFGSMMIVNEAAFSECIEKYNLDGVLKSINTRSDRMMLERLLGIIIYIECSLSRVPDGLSLSANSLNGDIFEQPASFVRMADLSLEQLLEKNKNYDSYLIKTWQSR